jgi:hypothetical protein
LCRASAYSLALCIQTPIRAAMRCAPEHINAKTCNPKAKAHWQSAREQRREQGRKEGTGRQRARQGQGQVMSRPRDDLVSSNHELYEKTELNDGENKKCGISSTVRTYMSDTSKNKNSLTTTLNQGRGGGSSSSKILSPPRKIPVPCPIRDL